MSINKLQSWLVLLILALVSVFIWSHLSLHRYRMIDLSVDRNEAATIAQNYLKQKLGMDPQGYQRATILSTDTNADRYLQKTLGVSASEEFIKRFNYDLFYWNVRFFKEKQREEFRAIVSSKTGEVINFSHVIAETASRPLIKADEALALGAKFITDNYHFSPEQYILRSQNIEKKENRVDYSFSWELKDVAIPWEARYGGGNSKLVMTVKVSGKDVLYFNKSQLSIPEGFNRHIDDLKQTGDNLMLLSQMLYLGLLTCAIMLLVNRKRYVIPRAVRPFYITVGTILFVSIILDTLNSYQSTFYGYPTTQLFWEYILRSFVQVCLGLFFTVIVFIVPGLSGESIRYETTPQEKLRGFLSPVLSTFFSVPVARSIWIGYLITPLILAVQSVIFFIGYRYFGIWDELSWLVQSSTAVIPALSAFAFGFQSSITEEIVFRLFAINLFKRYGLGSMMAVFLSALMWGIGHTGYAVFPMWFRGVEVTCLGIMFGLFYLRFGLITVIVAHFLIDAFRASLQYLLVPQLSFNFFSCLFVLIAPLLFSVFAFILNRSTTERPWKQKFTPQQEFNYQMLKGSCASKTPQELMAFKEELLRHGWDPAIIDRAFQDEEKQTS